MHYKCNDCGKKFDEPKMLQTTYEHYYGVEELFGNRTQLELLVCPYCQSENYDEIKETEMLPLKELRKLAGFKSQQSLADYMGVERITIAKWETGKAKPSHKNLMALCEALDCEVEDIEL